jgi:hypothetical protein
MKVKQEQLLKIAIFLIVALSDLTDHLLRPFMERRWTSGLDRKPLLFVDLPFHRNLT